MPSYLGYFSNSQRFWEFPKYSVIWEISNILNIYHPQFPIEIWGISRIPQIPRNLVNFPNTWESGEFPKYLGIWGITQLPGNLGNYQNSFFLQKYNCCRVMQQILWTCEGFNISKYYFVKEDILWFQNFFDKDKDDISFTVVWISL